VSLIIETIDVEEYLDALDFATESLDAEQPEDNDEYLYGGYGSSFDTYSTFDENDYEYQQSLYA
jgi:hypothetical protein